MAPPRVVADLMRPMQDALQALREGRGSPWAWDTLCDSFNLARALMDRQIAPDHRGTVGAGIDALRGISERVNAGQPWTLYPTEIRVLQDACEIHEIQLQLASQREIAESVRRVRRVYAAVHQGNASPAARIACIGALGRPRPNQE